MPQAYAINTIKQRGTSYPASTRTQATILDLEDEDFDRLEALGAVRKPTKDELTLWGASEAEKNGKRLTKKQTDAIKAKEAEEEAAAEAAATAAAQAAAAGSTPPDSGAKGDPRGKPKSGNDALGL